jgi:hypothetical protein
VTFAHRTLIALSIALATALTVAALVAIDARNQPESFERLHRD